MIICAIEISKQSNKPKALKLNADHYLTTLFGLTLQDPEEKKSENEQKESINEEEKHVDEEEKEKTENSIENSEADKEKASD